MFRWRRDNVSRLDSRTNVDRAAGGGAGHGEGGSWIIHAHPWNFNIFNFFEKLRNSLLRHAQIHTAFCVSNWNYVPRGNLKVTRCNRQQQIQLVNNTQLDLFLSAVWTFIRMAPIHCRGSIGEQVMQCYIEPCISARVPRAPTFLRP